METRSFSKREQDREQVYQISLDRKKLRIRWGYAGEDLRVQQLQFTSVDDARSDYFGRISKLAEAGYLDASE